ncbi:MAG: hypothetical protein VKK98_03585 [Cyanobacteriota bacterium]|nr:hypothetical protein [Cyanobacteriota bacterium]
MMFRSVQSPTGQRRSVSRGLARLTGALVATAAITGGLIPAALAQQGGAPGGAATAGGVSLTQVNALISRGDAAAAAGNLTEARKFYDQARDLTRGLLGWYRDLSGSFRGLDARIPREMDQKGRETLETLSAINLRLAAVFRRMNQPEVAVPLLVEVVKVMTPTSEQGRKAYQSLVEIGFVSTPYTAGQVSPAG